MIALTNKQFIVSSKVGLFLTVCFTLLAFALTNSRHACYALKQTETGTPPKAESRKIADYQKRLDALLAPVSYHYSPAGKPDPFRPFFRTSSGPKNKPSKKTVANTKKPSRCATPLECIDVGQLTLVGIVLGEDGSTVAMAQDASGIGYTLKPGMKIGYQKGEIVAIQREKVVVREQVEDIKGQLTYRDRVLYLHPEESDEAP